jgi:diguanylate cyclase (GGDEF)-like protein
MFLDVAQAMDDGAAIVLTWLSVLVTIILGVVILLIIRRNIKLAKEEHDVIVENAITKRAMVDSIRQYIKKVDRFGAMTLISVDVDGFADVNEVFGEKTGDQLLKEMAARILRVLPYKASLCKYEGDEFLIFIKDEDNRGRIEKLANQILDAVNSQYQIIIGENITLTASLGLVTYPVAGSTFEELYTNLELTTYVSKRDGGNKFTNYYASIHDDEMDNMSYYREVKHAISNKEYVLCYQPIVNLYD